MRNAPLDALIETSVDAFEAVAYSSPSIDFRPFLPPQDHEKFEAVLLELLRVRLDLLWSRGERRFAAEFAQDFPKAFANPEFRSQLAFEEFRLRIQAGENPDPTDYETQLGINTDVWQVGIETTHRPTNPESIEEDRNDAQHKDTIGLPETGSLWDGFRIIEALGKGTFGTAFLARQESLANRPVVLKFSSMNYDEAHKLAQLQHSNIVPILSLHIVGRQCVICMPFLGRRTLANEIASPLQDGDDGKQGEQSSRFPPKSAEDDRAVLEVVMKLADAIDHSHARGILHGDIKPANVIMTEFHEPLLCDFNLATDRQAKSGTSVIGGTLAYMAPEQLRRYLGIDAPVDQRADIYSLGVILFQMLTSKLPWCLPSGPVDFRDVLERRTAPIPLASALNRRLTPAVDAIIAKCLASDTGNRYASAGQLREDIRRQLDDLPLRHADNKSFSERLSKWIRRHPRVSSATTVGIAAAILFIGLAGLWVWNEQVSQAARAVIRLGEFSLEWGRLRPEFITAGSSDQLLDETLARAIALAEKYALNDRRNPINPLRSLNAGQREVWRQNASSLAFMISNALHLKSSQQTSDNARLQLLDDALQYSSLAKDWADSDSSGFALSRQAERLAALKASIQKVAVPSGPKQSHDELVEAPQSLDIGHKRPQESSINFHDGSWADRIILGIEARNTNHYVEAETHFRAAIHSNPSDLLAWLLFADASLHQKRYDTAIAAYDLCLALSSTDLIPSVRFQRGICFLATGDRRRAIQELSEVLHERPDLTAAWLNRGIAHYQQGNLDLALVDLDRSLDSPSVDPRGYFIRARVHTQMGNIEAATLDREKGIGATPCNALGWHARGIARMQMDPDGALADLKKSIDLDPGAVESLHTQAHIYSEILAKPAIALEILSQCIEANPADSFALAGRGVLHARNGDIDMAQRDADTLMSMPLDTLTKYQVVCNYVLCSPHNPALGPRALGLLAVCLREDPSLVEVLTTDPDMKAMSTNPELLKLCEAARLLMPSESHPPH